MKTASEAQDVDLSRYVINFYDIFVFWTEICEKVAEHHRILLLRTDDRKKTYGDR